MAEPTASRPYMPGYGLLDAQQGSGLLPWSWAVERLEHSHDYWVATTRPDGRPHVMPVRGVWMDNAYEPVVIEGEATLIDDRAPISAFVAALNRKYQTDYAVDFFNPTENACFRVPPTWAFGLTEADFTGTPTRWTFPPAPD